MTNKAVGSMQKSSLEIKEVSSWLLESSLSNFAIFLQETKNGIELNTGINREEVEKSVQNFCSLTKFDSSFIYALISVLLSTISVVESPKIIVSSQPLYSGEFQFTFTVDDILMILKNKKPLSAPRHDIKQKRYVPVFKEMRVKYTLTLTYDPYHDLLQIAYKIYPQKSIDGYRYQSKYRTQESLIKLLISSVQNYANQDTREVIVSPEDEESENGLEDVEQA